MNVISGGDYSRTSGVTSNNTIKRATASTSKREEILSAANEPVAVEDLESLIADANVSDDTKEAAKKAVDSIKDFKAKVDEGKELTAATLSNLDGLSAEEAKQRMQQLEAGQSSIEEAAAQVGASMQTLLGVVDTDTGELSSTSRSISPLQLMAKISIAWTTEATDSAMFMAKQSDVIARLSDKLAKMTMFMTCVSKFFQDTLNAKNKKDHSDGKNPETFINWDDPDISQLAKEAGYDVSKSTHLTGNGGQFDLYYYGATETSSTYYAWPSTTTVCEEMKKSFSSQEELDNFVRDTFTKNSDGTYTGHFYGHDIIQKPESLTPKPEPTSIAESGYYSITGDRIDASYGGGKKNLVMLETGNAWSPESCSGPEVAADEHNSLVINFKESDVPDFMRQYATKVTAADGSVRYGISLHSIQEAVRQVSLDIKAIMPDSNKTADGSLMDNLLAGGDFSSTCLDAFMKTLQQKQSQLASVNSNITNSVSMLQNTARDANKGFEQGLSMANRG